MAADSADAIGAKHILFCPSFRPDRDRCDASCAHVTGSVTSRVRPGNSTQAEGPHFAQMWGCSLGCLRVLHCGFSFLLFRTQPEPARAATPHMQVSRIAHLGFARVFLRVYTRDARVRRVTVDLLALGVRGLRRRVPGSGSREYPGIRVSRVLVLAAGCRKYPGIPGGRGDLGSWLTPGSREYLVVRPCVPGVPPPKHARCL